VVRMRVVMSGAYVIALATMVTTLVQGAWEPIGPPGGDVRDITADPRDPRAAYLGTSDGALYRSEDAGIRWTRLTPGLARRGVSLDDVIVTRSGDLLVGYWTVAGIGGGVAFSNDGGRSFAPFPGIEGHSVRGLAVAPSDPRIYVAVALDGVFRSDDAGASWRRISPPVDPSLPADRPALRNFGSVAVEPTNADVVYAGTWRLSWKSADGGKAWRLMPVGMIPDSDVMTLTIDRRSPTRVYATACSGIYRSIDGAAHWSRIQGIPASSRRTRAFLQDPRRAEVFYAGTTEGLWISEDDTRTWRRLSAPDLVVNAIEVLADGTILLGCDGLGVVRSTDGGVTWTASVTGPFERSVTCVFVDAEGNRVVGGVAADRAHGGVWATTWPNIEWRRLGAGLEAREVLVLTRASLGLLAGTDDGLFVLDDSEMSWRRLDTVVAGVDLHPRVVDAAQARSGAVVLATTDGLLRSVDGGRTWTRQQLGESQSVRAVVATAHNGRLHAATPLAFYASDDEGVSWTLTAGTSGEGMVRRVLASPLDDEMLFAATTRGLLKSADGGRTWRIRGGGLPLADITTLVLSGDTRTLLAADHTYGGLYRSEDLGETWSPLSTEGLPSNLVWSLALVPPSGELVAGAATGGLHRLATTGAGGGGTSAAAQ
jgi:photosystem II stability/assembly factor-like uncharacterized protein